MDGGDVILLGEGLLKPQTSRSSSQYNPACYAGRVVFWPLDQDISPVNSLEGGFKIKSRGKIK